MSKIRGIYAITHIESGRTYIGSSKNINRRFSSHKRDLKNKLHHNPHLQASWDKYGELSFRFEILEEILDEEVDLIDIENLYMIKYEIATVGLDRFCSQKGFNTCWADKTGCVDPAKYKKGKDHHLFGTKSPKKDKVLEDLYGIEKANEIRRKMIGTRTGKQSKKKHKHKHQWNEMTYNRQYKLWKNKDPMVPLDWIPRVKMGNSSKNWESLSYDYQRTLYCQNDIRVPAGWLPKLKKDKKNVSSTD
jgi:group I intron endonuclease